MLLIDDTQPLINITLGLIEQQRQKFIYFKDKLEYKDVVATRKVLIEKYNEFDFLTAILDEYTKNKLLLQQLSTRKSTCLTKPYPPTKEK